MNCFLLPPHEEIVVPQDQDLALISIPQEKDLDVTVIPYREHNMMTRSRNINLPEKASNYRAARMDSA